MNFVLQALAWADSHGLLTPAILAALTLLARALWAAVRPALAARWPRATEAAEAVGERVAAVLPDVLRALVPPRPQPSRETAPPGRSGEAGRVTVAALVTVTLLWLLVAALAACPRLPPVAGCELGAQRCESDRPEVCSASGRWHRVGDLPCAAVGGACLVAGGRAFCGVAEAAPGDVGLALDGGAR